jgi:hypothetical protein
MAEYLQTPSYRNPHLTLALKKFVQVHAVEPTLKSIPLIQNTRSAPSSGLQSPDRQQTKTRYIEAYNALGRKLKTISRQRPQRDRDQRSNR